MHIVYKAPYFFMKQSFIQSVLFILFVYILCSFLCYNYTFYLFTCLFIKGMLLFYVYANKKCIVLLIKKDIL